MRYAGNNYLINTGFYAFLSGKRSVTMMYLTILHYWKHIKLMHIRKDLQENDIL